MDYDINEGDEPWLAELRAFALVFLAEEVQDISKVVAAPFLTISFKIPRLFNLHRNCMVHKWSTMVRQWSTHLGHTWSTYGTHMLHTWSMHGPHT